MLSAARRFALIAMCAFCAVTAGSRLAGQERHWAFQPVRRPTPPDVAGAVRAETSIDRFVLARLETAGVTPSDDADRATLIRRATFDLLGVPPTLEEVANFVSDPAPDAYERLLDRLLASPRHGERWGRHWLDVARYADTKGYVFTQEPRYAFSYTYRDYVVTAINSDLPYDRFLLEQLAADQLDLGANKEPLAALGFLTLGRRFSNNVHDIIDDRIDVVTRGLMGLTVTCARCHDHKYDPIPMADYYSLYGVFASSTEPKELPQIGPAIDATAREAFEVEHKKAHSVLDKFYHAALQKLREELRTTAGRYLVEVAKPADTAVPEGAGLSFGKGEPRPRLVRKWREHLRSTARIDHPVLGFWAAFDNLSPGDFGAGAPKTLATQLAHTETNSLVRDAFRNAFETSPPASMIDVARVYGELLATEGERQADKRDPGQTRERRELLDTFLGPGTPASVSRNDARRLFDRATRNRLSELQRKVDALVVSSPGAPRRAMVLYDAPQPLEPRVFHRGNPARPGQTVPRRFLTALTPEPRPFQHGSGRLELAQAITSPDNPLTARVAVNRVWLHHFGQGLVRTPGDFGTRGEAPTHPALLDHLSAELVEGDWSLKRLHRLILRAAVYRQSSSPQDPSRRDNAARVDPENRLLWRMNRRRLEWEALRDSMLFVAGDLDQQFGGRAVDLFRKPFARRRTIYGFIDRQNLPLLFRVFDLASPDASCPKRHETTVPQQALFLMNSPFVIERATALAARAGGNDSSRAARGYIRRLYRAALSREPTAGELMLAQDFLEREARSPPEKLSPRTRLAQLLLMTNEFAYVE